jgi:membrane protease YdiL (CAAX protease family)
VARWRHRELLVLPLALSCLPLAAGLRADGDGAALAVLVVGYLLTGFTEELVWRGTVLQLLGPVGDRRAVLVASLLFGSAHLANVLFRGSVSLVLAQAFGAFCFGVGYSAIRLRTQALVPLMVAHLLTDLLPHLSRLPAIPVFVAQDVVLLAVGLVLLRRSSSP